MASKPNDMRAGRVRSLLRELRPQPAATITIGLGMPDDDDESDASIDPLTGKPIPTSKTDDGADADPNIDLFPGGDADDEDAEHETETMPGPAMKKRKKK